MSSLSLFQSYDRIDLEEAFLKGIVVFILSSMNMDSKGSFSQV